MNAATPRRRHRSYLIGLIGHGVWPSLTPPMHEHEGRRHGMNYVYRPVEFNLSDLSDGSPERLRALLEWAQTLGFDGLNITHPLKQTVLPLVDDLSGTARSIGAVNTIVFDSERGLIGHNTDVTGFRASLDDALAAAPCGRVVLVGAGGAGSAVAHGLAGRGVESLVIVDVDERRAACLVDDIRCEYTVEVSSARPDDVGRLLGQADGVVNATPFGMSHHPGTPFDTDALTGDMWVSDIVYRPVETQLVRRARAHGCRVIVGLGMAMHQAADAFEIFTGEAADRSAMLSDLRSLIETEEAHTRVPRP
ncbi:MAG: shikimate dehydrogenase [Nesterenkonia sp.]|nr:shikimate dehydrogenase [Nesterenkonia sp.]